MATVRLAAPRMVGLVALVLLVNIANVRREDARPEVCRAAGEENVVWVPVNCRHGGANGLLHVLANPPVILLLKVAHRDEPGTAANGKFVLLR